MLKKTDAFVIPMHSLVILVGPSGAGKSTLAAKHFQPHEIISSDAIRVELTGNMERQDINGIVFSEVRRRTELKLSLGERVVVDATHLKKRDRMASAEPGVKFGVPVIYLVWNRPLAEKQETAGWRAGVNPRPGVNLVEHHDTVFRNCEKEILSGDGIATVIDARKDRFDVIPKLPFENLLDLIREQNFGGVTAIGDVHGERLAFRRALHWAKTRGNFAMLLGDIVDYGPEALGCLEDAQEAVAQGWAAMTEGNHENKIRRWLTQRAEGNIKLKLSEGNRATTDAFDALSSAKQEQWEFKFRSLLGMSRLHWQIGRHVFVHGAADHRFFDNHRAKLGGDMESMAYFGQIDKDTPTRADGFPNRIYKWVDLVPKAHTVVVGHDIRSIEKPLTVMGAQGGKAIFLDTGSGKTINGQKGILTSADFKIGKHDLELINYTRHDNT